MRQCQRNTLLDSMFSINLEIFETPCSTIKINQNNVQRNVTTKRAPFKTSKNIPYILNVHCIILLFPYCTLFGFFREITHLPKYFRIGNNYLMLQIKELRVKLHKI